MAINKHIVFTRPNGDVEICTPSKEVLADLREGGFWGLMPPHFVDEQIHIQMLGGVREDHAVRFAKAIWHGGVEEREAYDIIKDRDCARHGTLHEIITTDEIPVDRWFRNAWRRSRNGGPIGVDLALARRVHWDRMCYAVRQENALREWDLVELRPVAFDKNYYRSQINRARDEAELRLVWPEEVPRYEMYRQN